MPTLQPAPGKPKAPWWRRGRRPAAVFLAAAAFYLIALLSRFNPYDDGLRLAGAARILDGQVPHRDFCAIYGPAEFYAPALVLRGFGVQYAAYQGYRAVIGAAGVLMVYLIARRLGAGVAASTGVAWLVLLLGEPAGAQLALVLAAGLFAAASSRTGWLGFVGTGALVGACALFRPDFGAAAMLAALVAVLLAPRSLGDGAGQHITQPPTQPDGPDRGTAGQDPPTPPVAGTPGSDRRIRGATAGLSSRATGPAAPGRPGRLAALVLGAGVAAGLGYAPVVAAAPRAAWGDLVVHPLSLLPYRRLPYGYELWNSHWALSPGPLIERLSDILVYALPVIALGVLICAARSRGIAALWLSHAIRRVRGRLAHGIDPHSADAAAGPFGAGESRSAARRSENGLTAFLVVLAVGVAPYALGRSDRAHVMPLAVCSLLVIVAVSRAPGTGANAPEAGVSGSDGGGSASADRTAGKASRDIVDERRTHRGNGWVARLFVGVVAAIVVAVTCWHTLRYARGTPFRMARAAGMRAFGEIEEAQIENVRWVVSFLRSRTAPGEPILSACWRHDRISFNYALLYFLAARHGATRWDHFDPGFTTQAEVQRRIVEQCEAAGVRWVARWRAPVPGEPNRSRSSTGVHVLDDYLATNFEPVAQAGSFQIWRRKADR